MSRTVTHQPAADERQRARPVERQASGPAASIDPAPSPTRISLGIYLLVGAALVLLALWAFNPTPCSDLWWQMKTGELIWNERAIPSTDRFSFMADGQPWIIQEWASEVMFYLLYTRISPSTMVLYKMLVFAAALGLGLATAWTRCRNPLVAVGTALLVGYSMHYFADMRPQMLSYLCLAAVLFLLERDRAVPGSRCRWLLPLVMLLWVNFHAGFMAGVTVLLAAVGGSLIEAWFFNSRSTTESTSADASGPTRPAWRRLLLPVGLALLATVVNPYGPAIYTYPFTLLHHDSMLNFVQEWFSPDFHDSWSKGYQLCLFLVAGALALTRRTRRPAELLLLLFWAYQSLQSRRHIPVFLIVALPSLAEHLAGTGERIGEWLRETGRRPLHVSPGVATAVLIVLVGVGIARAQSALPRADLFEHSGSLRFYPQAACDFIQRQGWAGRMYNEFDWGGYCIWRFFPRQKVFIDGRCEVYFGGPWENHQAIHYAQAGWDARLRDAEVDTLLVKPNSYLNQVLPTTSEWVRVYADDMALVYRRLKPFEP